MGSTRIDELPSFQLGPEGVAVGVEHIPELVELSQKNVRKHNADLLDGGRLRFVCGDGRQGFPEAAPFDVIHVGAGATEVPKIVRSLQLLSNQSRVAVGRPVGGGRPSCHSGRGGD